MAYKSIVKNKSPQKSTGYVSVVNKKQVSQPAPESPRLVSLPEHLGGGEYLTNSKAELIKTPRSQDSLPAVGSAERDHIISVALGGTSSRNNLQYLSTTKEGRQAGKVSVEQQAINDYVNGKISLQEARLKVATKQQQIKGLTPTDEEQTTKGQIGNVIKDAFKKIVRPFTAEGRKEKEENNNGLAKNYELIAGVASDALGRKIEPKDYLEAVKSFTQEEKDLVAARANEKSVEKTASVLTAPIRYTAGALATALVSYGAEKADSNLSYTPVKDSEKLLIGEQKIQRLLEQEDLYGMIARGVGIPAALTSIAVIENPFLQGTGVSAGIKKFLKKKAEKIGAEFVVKLGADEFVKIIDDVIKTEQKTGRITSMEAKIAKEEVNALRATKEPLENITPKSVDSKPLVYEKLTAEPSVPNRIKDEAIENGLLKDFKGIDDYDKVSFKDQAKKVGEIIDEDPEKAIRIALGRELPTNGALPESVFIAVKNQAIKNGDTDLLIRLATEEGGVAKESTVLGQRIKMLDEQLEDDAFRNINEVIKTRRKVAETKGININKAKSKEVGSIKNELKKTIPVKDEWLSFVDEITC